MKSTPIYMYISNSLDHDIDSIIIHYIESLSQYEMHTGMDIQNYSVHNTIVVGNT